MPDDYIAEDIYDYTSNPLGAEESAMAVGIILLAIGAIGAGAVGIGYFTGVSFTGTAAGAMTLEAAYAELDAAAAAGTTFSIEAVEVIKAAELAEIAAGRVSLGYSVTSTLTAFAITTAAALNQAYATGGFFGSHQ